MASPAQERVPFPETEDQGPDWTRSADGNFVVKGADPYTRGNYSDFAVAARKEFQSLMNFNGELKFPIIIELRSVPGNRSRGYPVRPLAIVTPKYSPNIRVTLCESFRFAYLREELVRFFLMDYSLRNRANAGAVVEKRGDTLIPQWLWAGVSEAIGFKESGEPSDLFAAVFESGKLMGIDEILTADPDEMGSLSRAIYRASAGGLVLTLLQQDGGPGRMRNFIDALATAPQDHEALLNKYFDGINLEKWWALQVARMAKPTALDILSIEETEYALRRALVVSVMENRRAGAPQEVTKSPRRPRLRIFNRKVDDPPEEIPDTAPVESERVTYDIEDFHRFAGRADIGEILHANELRLIQLSYRSFPLYRPLIKSYLDLIGEIEAGKTKGVQERFASLASTRAGLLRSGKMAEDVMNLHEATQSDQSSGEFDEYFKLYERLQQDRPERKDEISRYLDRIQAEYE